MSLSYVLLWLLLLCFNYNVVQLLFLFIFCFCFSLFLILNRLWHNTFWEGFAFTSHTSNRNHRSLWLTVGCIRSGQIFPIIVPPCIRLTLPNTKSGVKKIFKNFEKWWPTIDFCIYDVINPRKIRFRPLNGA